MATGESRSWEDREPSDEVRQGGGSPPSRKDAPIVPPWVSGSGSTSGGRPSSSRIIVSTQSFLLEVIRRSRISVSSSEKPAGAVDVVDLPALLLGLLVDLPLLPGALPGDEVVLPRAEGQAPLNIDSAPATAAATTVRNTPAMVQSDHARRRHGQGDGGDDAVEDAEDRVLEAVGAVGQVALRDGVGRVEARGLGGRRGRELRHAISQPAPTITRATAGRPWTRSRDVAPGPGHRPIPPFRAKRYNRCPARIFSPRIGGLFRWRNKRSRGPRTPPVPSEIWRGSRPSASAPEWYIGSTDGRGLQQLIEEVVDNSIDEVLAGFCTDVTLVLHEDGTCSVTDNGRGIPSRSTRGTTARPSRLS